MIDWTGLLERVKEMTWVGSRARLDVDGQLFVPKFTTPCNIGTLALHGIKKTQQYVLRITKYGIAIVHCHGLEARFFIIPRGKLIYIYMN